MKNTGFSYFKIGLYAALVIGIVLAILIFSGKIPLGQDSAVENVKGTVTIWGVLPRTAVGAMIDQVKKTYEDVTVNYVSGNAATFQSDLVNALASGRGPDMIFVTPADIIANYDRLYEIPYANLPQSAFSATFVDQGSQFLTDTGIVAFPLVIDPLIMYYNRDMLTSAFIVEPPETWEDVIAVNKKVTQKDDAGTLSTETVALGTYDNITHAKDILANLIFQAGNKIVAWDPVQKKYVSTFAGNNAAGESAVENAFQFYTNFANPNDADRYSWNATLPTDKNQFIAGKLAIYFGYASELSGIRQKNPNLNFDVAMMPQRAKGTFKSTYGKMTGIAIMRLTKNPSLSFLVAKAMAGSPALTGYLGEDSTLAPARKDMLTNTVPKAAPTNKPSFGVQEPEKILDSRQTLFYNSAIISRSFLDPDSAQTSSLFRKYITDINAGVAQPRSILSPGNSLLSGILSKVQKKSGI